MNNLGIASLAAIRETFRRVRLHRSMIIVFGKFMVQYKFRFHSSALSLLGLVLAAFLSGCGAEKAAEDARQEAKKAQDQLTEAEKCRRKMAAAMSRLSPERVALAADPERSVNGLNSWVASCGTEEIGGYELDQRAIELLNQNPRVTAKRFTESDGYYIRDSLLLRNLSDAIVSRIDYEQSDKGREEARVIEMFQWTNRHVSLIEGDQTELPMNLFDVLMLGEGTVSHRAWLFAELLRQQQIDCVLVTTTAEPTPLKEADSGSAESKPAEATESEATETDTTEAADSEAGESTEDEPTEGESTQDESQKNDAEVPDEADSKDGDSSESTPPSSGEDASETVPSLLDTSRVLVVVFNEGAAWMFDPAVGLPVTPDATFDPLAPGSAPLSLLLEHPRWKEARLEVIGQASTFAPRMLALQDNLAAADAAVFYEELTGGTSDIRPLLERIQDGSGGEWKSDRITVWPFPEEMATRSHALSESEQQIFDKKMTFFDAPFERDLVNVESEELTFEEQERLTPEEKKALVQDKIIENFRRMMDSETSTSEDRFGTPSRKLLMARILQISGDIGTPVIQQLQQVRIASMQQFIRVAVPEALKPQVQGADFLVLPLPPVIQEVNESSTGNSLYWTALCQLERNEAGAAVITLANYRRQYPNGRWKYPSLLNEATAFLIQGRTERAIKSLKEADVADNPERQRAQRILAAIQQ